MEKGRRAVDHLHQRYHLRIGACASACAIYIRTCENL